MRWRNDPERGKTGDHGQVGQTGNVGSVGPTGKTGPQGIGLVGRQGPAGERGPLGDHGQDGAVGPQGEPGKSGLTGQRGRGLTRWQGLAMFLIVSLIGILGFAWVERQQDEIDANTQAIAEAQYQSCLGGVRILSRFNQQQLYLAEVEEALLRDKTASPAGKRAAASRIDIYKAGMIVPLPQCVKR